MEPPRLPHIEPERIFHVDRNQPFPVVGARAELRGVHEIEQPHGATVGDVHERIDRRVGPELRRQPGRVAIEGVQQPRPRALGPAQTQHRVDRRQLQRQVPLEVQPAVGIAHASIQREQQRIERGAVSSATIRAGFRGGAARRAFAPCGGVHDGRGCYPVATLQEQPCPPRQTRSAERSKTTSRPGPPTTRSSF